MKRFLSILLVLALISIFFAGCSGSNSGTSTSASSNSSTIATNAPVDKQSLVLGTGGTSGTYYIVGAALADMWTKKASLSKVTAQATAGAMENINMVGSGDIQIGFANSDAVYYAYTGTGSYAKAGKQNIDAIASLYMSAGQMAVLDSSSIKSFADLKGKKVCLGAQGSTMPDMSLAILKAYGLTINDITPYYLAIDEGLSKITDGEIDACFFVAGVPVSGLMNASQTKKMRLLSIDKPQMDQLTKDYPYYLPYTIKAGTYKGIDTDVNVLKAMTTIFCSPNLSDDVVYDITKTLFENLADIQDAHSVCKEINVQTAAQLPIPIHPGALKYYKEQGAAK